MPKGKLKHALMAHQASAAKAAHRKRVEEANKSREEAIARNVRTNGASKAKKRPRPDSSTTASVDNSDRVEEGDKKGKAKGKGKAKATIPFDHEDTILLLGEANFSFALSLLQHHHHPAHRLCATNYDSEEVCFEKYPDAEHNVGILKEAGVRVEFGIDAGKLDGYKWIGKGRWSRVIFNFPHAGAGITDQDRNILSNQILLLRTFRAVYHILTRGPSRFPSSAPNANGKGKEMRGKANNKRKRAPSDDEGERELSADDNDDDLDDLVDLVDLNVDVEGDDANFPTAGDRSGSSGKDASPPKREGTILITLLDQPPYSLWDLRKLAIRPPAHIPSDKTLECKRFRLLRSFAFIPSVYPGYAHRRTIGFKDGISKAQNEEIEGRRGGARTWEFALLSSTSASASASASAAGRN